uniref:Myb/SANT-like domain-containing protein n=1 Tax=Chenopodium quinoa TaxID=63459 RepID=A0A803L9U5_CHEQI
MVMAEERESHYQIIAGTFWLRGKAAVVEEEGGSGMSDLNIQESRKRPRDDDDEMDIVVMVLGFIMVVVGAWYGSASDPRVLRDALRRPNGLKVPKNKYLLVDLGYSNAEGFLAPYKGPLNIIHYEETWERAYGTFTITKKKLYKLMREIRVMGEFKSQAYQAVVDNVRKQLGILVTMDQVKNRIKVWKKHHSVINDIKTYTKFKWDDKKKMIVIPVEDLQAWHIYCMVAVLFIAVQETPAASAYQNKCFENWDDICTLFAPDRAIGDGAEQHEEAAAAMENENDNANAVSSFAESFKEYVSKSTRPTSQEIYKEASSVLGISRHQALRAVKRFLNGTFEEFDMLKNLPDDQKLDWIILCIDE